jgi:hypothetical protein
MGLIVALVTAPVMIACPCCHTAAVFAATNRMRIARRSRRACCLWAASSCHCRRWRRHSRRPLEECCRRREAPSTWGRPRREWVGGVSVLRLKPFSAAVIFAVVANGQPSFAARPQECVFVSIKVSEWPLGGVQCVGVSARLARSSK